MPNFLEMTQVNTIIHDLHFFKNNEDCLPAIRKMDTSVQLLSQLTVDGEEIPVLNRIMIEPKMREFGLSNAEITWKKVPVGKMLTGHDLLLPIVVSDKETWDESKAGNGNSGFVSPNTTHILGSGMLRIPIVFVCEGYRDETLVHEATHSLDLLFGVDDRRQDNVEEYFLEEIIAIAMQKSYTSNGEKIDIAFTKLDKLAEYFIDSFKNNNVQEVTKSFFRLLGLHEKKYDIWSLIEAGARFISVLQIFAHNEKMTMIDLVRKLMTCRNFDDVAVLMGKSFPGEKIVIDFSTVED